MISIIKLDKKTNKIVGVTWVLHSLNTTTTRLDVKISRDFFAQTKYPKR